MLQVHKFTTGETIKANANSPETGKLLVSQVTINANGWLETRIASIGGKLSMLQQQFGHLRAGDAVPGTEGLCINKVQTRTEQYDNQALRTNAAGEEMLINNRPYYETQNVVAKGTKDSLLTAEVVAETVAAEGVEALA